MSPFDRFIATLNRDEPRTGWTNPEQIRTLTDAEVALCLDEAPELLCHLPSACVDDYARLISRELQQESSPAQRAGQIGFIVRNRLEELCRAWLLGELAYASLLEEERHAGA
jgi:hypothetical protein